MTKKKKNIVRRRILLGLSFLLIIIFAIIDTFQIRAFFETNTWEQYFKYVLPSFFALWIIVLAVIAIVYFIFVRDLSESIALFSFPAILILTGTEDIFYFLFSPQRMLSCMDYLNNMPFINFVSKFILRETCVSPLGLFLNAFLGIIIASGLWVILTKIEFGKWV